MSGLRYVRSTYQARLSAWVHLASTSLSDPTRPGEKDEASQVVINPLFRDLQRWLASPTGNAFVREIRWALLPSEVAVRRLRAVAPCQRLRDQALAHALLNSGAAFLVARNALCHCSDLSLLTACAPCLRSSLLDMWRCLPPYLGLAGQPMPLVPWSSRPSLSLMQHAYTQSG